MKQNFEVSLAKSIQNTSFPRGAFEEIPNGMMYFCLEQLRLLIERYRDEFVLDVEDIIATDSVESFVLPENTKFYRKKGNLVIFVIENKPSVRNLHFDIDSNINTLEKSTYRLALPYLVFIPFFSIEKNQIFFKGMCVAYRKESLNNIDDMLYYTNLPNMGDGHNRLTTRYNSLLVCLGYGYDWRNFNLNSSNFSLMVKELIDHFWNSEYNDDLSSGWEAMRKKDSKLGTLGKWEKESEKDPFFVLKSNWIPAIKLNKLIDSIFIDNDDVQLLHQATSQYVHKIHNQIWQKLCGNFDGKKELIEIFIFHLKHKLHIFVCQVAKDKIFDDATMQRTIKAAVTKALKETFQ